MEGAATTATGAAAAGAAAAGAASDGAEPSACTIAPRNARLSSSLQIDARRARRCDAIDSLH